MSAIVSLRLLSEPAYIVVGAVLPDDGSGEVRLLVSPDTVLAYPEDLRPLITYLSVLRSRSELLEQLPAWGAEPSDLDDLVQAGVLLELPTTEGGVREAVSPLAVRIAADAAPAFDGKSWLLRLPSGRSVGISVATAAVLDAPTVRSLATGVRVIAEGLPVPEDDLWRSVLHDLTGILTTRAGSFVRVGGAR